MDVEKSGNREITSSPVTENADKQNTVEKGVVEGAKTVGEKALAERGQQERKRKIKEAEEIATIKEKILEIAESETPIEKGNDSKFAGMIEKANEAYNREMKKGQEREKAGELNKEDEATKQEIKELEKLNTNEILKLAISQAGGLNIRPEDRDNEGKLLVYPKGPPSNLKNELHWKIVRTIAFKEWFGDWQNNSEDIGKVVDRNGEPLLVYHTSDKAFAEFKPEESSHTKTLGRGSYFTPDKTLSSIYGNLTYSCFLNVKNIVDIPNALIIDNRGTVTLKDFKAMIKTFYYSIVRPRDTALCSLYNDDEISSKEMYGDIKQFSVLHKKNIMIVPNDMNNPSLLS